MLIKKHYTKLLMFRQQLVKLTYKLTIIFKEQRQVAHLYIKMKYTQTYCLELLKVIIFRKYDEFQILEHSNFQMIPGAFVLAGIHS